MLSAGAGLGRADLGEDLLEHGHNTQCHSVLQSPVFWDMVKGGKPYPQLLCSCSGKEWLGISKTATALTILVAGIVSSGWHAYIQSRKILLVDCTAELFRSSCFPCTKLREGAKQGANIKGPSPEHPVWGAAAALWSLHSHRRTQKAETLSK